MGHAPCVPTRVPSLQGNGSRSIRPSFWHNPKSSYWKGAKALNFHRHCKEFEARIWKLSESAKMFDDWYVVRQKNRMCRTTVVASVINVVRIYPHQSRTTLRQLFCRSFSQKRVISI